MDEIESYAPLYDQASFATWDDDTGTFAIDIDKPYVFASFDDPDFAPSLGPKYLQATAQERLLFFLRSIRTVIESDAAAGKPPRWACLVQDTFSGIAELAYNAQLSEMGIVSTPKARSGDGSEFFLGLAARLGDVSRASRALRAYGMHWLATSHVTVREVSDTAKAGALSASQQHMPLITGMFRERFTPMFDVVVHTNVDNKGEHYCLWKPEVKRQAKSRYGALNETKRIANDWPTIMTAIDNAQRPGAADADVTTT
jgi:hypothetical protein